ncbi:hypothetical protein [Nonomuraea sp. NPDC049625]|uniref:hypothetical protein n=1 Tax=Nonomuraea sp. NPDC049625 TaxID=3155775 RepID=UPI00343832A6
MAEVAAEAVVREVHVGHVERPGGGGGLAGQHDLRDVRVVGGVHDALLLYDVPPS